MTQTASSLPLFLIEPRPRLRAAITHHLSLHGLHVEPFEALNEFTDRNFESGIVLVNDDLSLSSQLARWIQKGGSKLVHIAYAVELSASRVLRAVNEGAINFIEWPADKDRLIEILNNAAAQLRPEIEARQRMVEAKARVGRLTTREREVLGQMVDGETNTEIGKKLSISPRTVEIHRSNLLLKLHARNSLEAVRIALEADLPRGA